MASTGTEEVNPIKIGAPAVDYATGTMGAFALAAALFQRERTGKGQHIDLAMLGVAMMMQASLMTGYFRNGSEPKPHGNKQPFATNSAYDAKEGMVMIGASNIRQQARFWRAVERPDMIKTDNEARVDDREREAAVIADIIKTKTADEWEALFPGAPRAGGAGADDGRGARRPAFRGARGVFHRFDGARRRRRPVRRCRWRRSNSPMAGRRSSTRRTRWAPTPMRSWRARLRRGGDRRVAFASGSSEMRRPDCLSQIRDDKTVDNAGHSVRHASVEIDAAQAAAIFAGRGIRLVAAWRPGRPLARRRHRSRDRDRRRGRGQAQSICFRQFGAAVASEGGSVRLRAVVRRQTRQ